MEHFYENSVFHIISLIGRAKGSNTVTIDIKPWMREAVREHLKGSCDAVTKLSISFSCIYFTSVWILSASPAAHWPSEGLLSAAFCHPLSLNVSTSIPLTTTQNADMLEHRPRGNNEMNHRGDGLRRPGIHSLICSELKCVNKSAKAQLEFGHSWHIWRIHVTWRP